MTVEEMYNNATQSQADLSQFSTTEDGIKKDGVLMVDPEEDMLFQNVSVRIKMLADKYHMTFQDAALSFTAAQLDNLNEMVDYLPHNIAAVLKKNIL